ncbi:proline-rich protein 18 [Amazona aestiva]|uniref:Proline-rich protein 18 n=1 Tax=Amazona aestiva TaxID=12930 RepID=A0A0Q3PWI5_AMAAE|nr:proline-rich protein 18 [Amazona aestiva]
MRRLGARRGAGGSPRPHRVPAAHPAAAHRFPCRCPGAAQEADSGDGGPQEGSDPSRGGEGGEEGAGGASGAGGPPLQLLALLFSAATAAAAAAGRTGGAPQGSRSCESLGGVPGETEPRFSLSLPPEAVRVLQRRSLERQRGQPLSGPGGRATPTPARRGARAGSGDLRALLKISLLNEKHRYDDEEYEEEEATGAAVDEGLVRKCTEWLRGVESAAGRDRPDRLETLPHLSTL